MSSTEHQDAEHPPWNTGDMDLLSDEVYDALVPLDGFPKGSRGGPRIYSYLDHWWVSISLSDFGDLLVGSWGELSRDANKLKERLT